MMGRCLKMFPEDFLAKARAIQLYLKPNPKTEREGPRRGPSLSINIK
jgi:hypothetical protein